MMKHLKANKPQLCMIDCCAGLDNLDDDQKALGDLEVLTTFSSSFFWKGTITEGGTSFEGVTNSEGMEALMALFEGLSKEEGYEPIRTRVNEAISSYAHERNPNLVFPTLEDYREVRWNHLDGDADGRMDSNDVLYQFGLKKALADPNHEFQLRDDGAFDELNGNALKDAVLDLNVATHYNGAIGSSNDAVIHKFLGNGYFDGKDSRELIHFEDGTNPEDGSSAIRVSFNSGLAHTGREALEALTQYLSMLYLSDKGKVSGLGETDKKLVALCFAAFRINFTGQDRMNDAKIWRQLLEVLRLPSDLPWGAMSNLINSEEHDYSGSLAMANRYKQSLSASSITALASPSVGRPGDAPPVG
jgi:hypothetical protein